MIFGVVTGVVLVVVLVRLLVLRAHSKSEQVLKESFGRVPAHKIDMQHLRSYHIHALQSYGKDSYTDTTTWNDLSMDSVYQRINTCHCSIGEEYLYHILHDIHAQLSTLKFREMLRKWLSEDVGSRLHLQRILEGIGKRSRSGLATYLFDPVAKRLRHDWVYGILALLPLVALAVLPFSIQVGMGLLLCIVCANVTVSVSMGRSLEGDLESLRYFSALVYGAKVIQRVFGGKLYEVETNELAVTGGNSKAKLVAGKGDAGNLGYDLKVALAPYKNMRGVLPGSMHRTAAELELPFLLFKAVFLADLILYNHTVDLMISHNLELRRLYEIVGELDVAVSAASFCASLPWYCSPNFRKENTIEVEEGYHPLIVDPVPNSVVLDNDCIVTGSNASGKSTFIKMIAVNHILAQTLHVCCARSYSLGRTHVVSSMALRDDIESGESYFMAEIRSLRRIMDECKSQKCVCFIDEILRGTNTPERIAASTAVLRVLHQTDSLCLVASHDVELTKILEGVYGNYHFSEHFGGDEVVFDYLLKEGPSRTRNAIRLLEYMGFDPHIVAEARAMLGKPEDEADTHYKNRKERQECNASMY